MPVADSPILLLPREGMSDEENDGNDVPLDVIVVASADVDDVVAVRCSETEPEDAKLLLTVADNGSISDDVAFGNASVAMSFPK